MMLAILLPYLTYLSLRAVPDKPLATADGPDAPVPTDPEPVESRSADPAGDGGHHTIEPADGDAVPAGEEPARAADDRVAVVPSSEAVDGGAVVPGGPATEESSA
jgi:hypothetical protein